MSCVLELEYTYLSIFYSSFLIFVDLVYSSDKNHSSILRRVLKYEIVDNHSWSDYAGIGFTA